MDIFLRETKNVLESAQGDSDMNIHVVLGNEACDLDSAVSALVWAYHLSKHQEAQHKWDIVVPVLNIPRHDLPLRTEVTHFLSALNHDDDSLVFRDEVNLNNLHAEGRLSLTLVDHNTLPKGDAPLDAAVKEIIDHHSNSRHDDGEREICVTIETVGSCSTLVTEKILADNCDVIDGSIAKLLLGPILADTVNLSASAGKATPKDIAMVEQLSQRCPDLDKDQMYQELQQAKADVSGFTSEEILRKDFKCVTGSSMNIGMSSIPMNLKDFVEKPSVERDLHDFCTSKNLRLLVLMSLTLDQDDEAHRQISVYSSKTSDSMKDELIQMLDESSSPALILSELDTDSPGVVVYSQGNVKASRKQVLPLVKDFLNSQENSSAADDEEEQEEEVVTESDMSDINATLLRLSSNDNNANDTLTSDDPFDMGDNQAISSPDSSGIDAGSMLLDLDLFPGNQNRMATSESGTFSSADSAGTLGFTPSSPGSDAVGFGNGTDDLLGLDPFGSGQPTDSATTPVPPSNPFAQSSGDDLFGLDAFMTQPAAASDPAPNPFGDPVIHDYAADPFGVSIMVDPEAQGSESTTVTLLGNNPFGMDGETSSSDLLGLGTVTASPDSESQPIHYSVSTTVESSWTDIGDFGHQQPGSPDQEDSKNNDDIIRNDQDAFLVTTSRSNAFTVSDETQNDPFGMGNFESQTSEPKVEDEFPDPSGGTVVPASADVDSFGMDTSGFADDDQSGIPESGVIIEPFEELNAEPSPSFNAVQDDKEMSSGSNFDQDELDVQGGQPETMPEITQTSDNEQVNQQLGSPDQEDSKDEDDIIRNDQDAFLVTTSSSNAFTVSDETQNDPFGMGNFESQTSEPKVEDEFPDPFGGTVVPASADVDSFGMDKSGFADDDQSGIPEFGVIKEPFEELKAEPSPSFDAVQDDKEMSSGSNFDQDELDVQGGQPEITITQTSDNEKVDTEVEYSDNFEEESPRLENPEVDDEGFNETDEAETSLQDEVNEIWEEVKPDEEEYDDDEYENEEDVREEGQEVNQVVASGEKNTNTADEENNAESSLSKEDIVLDVASESLTLEVSDVVDDSQENDVQSFQQTEIEGTEEQPTEAFIPEKYLQEVDDVVPEEEEAELEKVENQATEADICDETLEGGENLVSPMNDQEVTEEPDNFESKENEPSASTEESVPEELSFEDDQERRPVDRQDSEDQVGLNSDLQDQDSNREDEESSVSEPQPVEEVENVVAAMIAQEMLDVQRSDLHHQDTQEDQESKPAENLILESSFAENVQQDMVSVLGTGAEEDDKNHEELEEENVDQSLGVESNDDVLDTSNVDLNVIESSIPVEFLELESDESAKLYENQDSSLEDSEVQPTKIGDNGGFSDLLQGEHESEGSFISPSDDVTGSKYPEESEPLEELEEDTSVSVEVAEPLESSKPGDLPIELVIDAESLERNISPISDEAHTRSSGITSPDSEFTSDIISEDPSSGDSYTVTDISRDVTNFKIVDIKEEEEEDQVTESTETTEINIVDTTLEEKLEDFENQTNGDVDESLPEEISKDLETGVIEDHFSEESQAQKDELDRISIPTDVGLCDSGRSSPKVTEQDSSAMQEEAHDYVEEVIKMAKFAYTEKLHQDRANLEEVSGEEQGEEQLSNASEDAVLIQRVEVAMQEHESAVPASKALVNGDIILEASSVSQKESSLYIQKLNSDDEEPSVESVVEEEIAQVVVSQEESVMSSNADLPSADKDEEVRDNSEPEVIEDDVEDVNIDVEREESSLYTQKLNSDDEEPSGQYQEAAGESEADQILSASLIQQEHSAPASGGIFGNSLLDDEVTPVGQEEDANDASSLNGDIEEAAVEHPSEEILQATSVSVESTEPLNMEQTIEFPESSSNGDEDLLQPDAENDLPIEPVESVVEEEIAQVVVSQEESVMSSNAGVPSADKDEEVQDVSEPEVIEDDVKDVNIDVEREESYLYTQKLNSDDEEPSGQFQEAAEESEADQILSASLIQQEHSAPASGEVFGNSLLDDGEQEGEQEEDANEASSLNGDLGEPAVEHHSEEILQATSVSIESTEPLKMEQTGEGPESSSDGAQDVLQPDEQNYLPSEPSELVDSVVEEEIAQVVVSQEESVMSSNADLPSADKDEEVQDVSEPEVVLTSEANTEQGVPLHTEENPGDTADEEPQTEIEVNVVINEQGLQEVQEDESGNTEESSLGKTKLIVEDDVKDVDIEVEREDKPAALYGLADILEYVDPDGNVEGSADSAVRPSTLALPNRSTPTSKRLLSTGTPGSAISDTGTPLTPISMSSMDMLTPDTGTDEDILDKSREDLTEEGHGETLAVPLAVKRSVSIDPDMAEDIHGEWDDKKKLMDVIIEKERRKSMTEKPTHHRELSVATAEAMKNMEGVTIPDEWQDDEFSQQKLAGVDSTQEEESFFRRRVPSKDGKLRTRDSMMSDDGSVDGMSAWAERLAGDDNFDEDEDGDLSPLQASSTEQRNRKISVKKVVHIPAGLDISIEPEVNGSATPAILTPTSTEMSWDDDTLQRPRADVEAIPEYTAKEESEDRRNWRKVVIANKEFTVDMRAINPYKKVLSHGGYYGEGVNAIIVIASCYMPERSRKDYNYIMNNLFLYVISTLELLVAQEYMIVYFHGAAPKDRIPSMNWMRKCYQMIDRKLRKNLKGLFIVHPTTWLRTIVRFTRPFISSKFSRKLKFVENLDELSTMVTMEYVYVPDEVRRFDEQRSEKEGGALWGQYAMAVSRCSLYLWCLPSAVAAAQCTLGYPWLAMSEAVSWWISGRGRSGSESGSCYTMGPDLDTTTHDEDYTDEMLYCPTSRAARRRMSMQLRRGNFALAALSRERAKDFEDFDSSDYIEDDMFADIEDDGGEEGGGEEEEEETDGGVNNPVDEDTADDEKCNDLHQDLEYDEEFHQFTHPLGPLPRYHPGEQHRHYSHHPLETVPLEETRKTPSGTSIQWHKRKQSGKR